jgi:outer membrane immunogenic protein
MLRKFFIIGALAAGTLASARAADVAPVRTPIAPGFVAAPGMDWSGFYIGGHLGGVGGDTTVTIPNYPAGFGRSDSSLIGGGQIGFNYMTPGRWVFGVETDISWMGLTGAGTVGGAGESFSAQHNLMVTARGRIGYAFDNLLVYGTGGLAWANLRSAFYTPAAGGPASSTQLGWTAGGGVDYALTPRWSLGVEYLYGRFDGSEFTFTGPRNPTAIDLDTHTVRARLNYLFNWERR